MSATKTNAAKRINFGKVELLAEQPDLLGIQIQSFKDFFQLETTPDKRNVEGLFRVRPVEDDELATTWIAVLEQ